MSDKSPEEKQIFRKGYYGFLMCIIGPITFFYFPDLMEFIIQKNMKLKEGDIIVENWSNPPMGIYVQIFMFNITNPNDVPKGKPPVLNEVGPFVMRLQIRKIITKWNKEEETLEYKQKISFFIEDEMSHKSVNQTIYLLNMPAVGAASLLKESGLIFLGSGIFNSVMKEETLIQNTTVRGMIAEGLKVQFLDSLSKKPFLSFLQSTFDKILKNGTINLLYLMNRAEPMTFEVATGYKDGYSMGEIISFEGQKKMKNWGNEYCDMINGSEGITFKYPVKRKIQYFFFPQFCRSLKLDYMGNDDVFGIPTKKFYLNTMFQSPRFRKSNSCFCTEPVYCQYNGTLPLDKCMFGIPITFSKPHFYGADPIFRELVKGLKPDADKHQSYFHINTMLAMPLQVKIGIQINMNVKVDKRLKILAKMKNMMMPIVWINVTAGIMGTGHEWAVYLLMRGPVYMAGATGICVTGFGLLRLSRAFLFPLKKEEINKTSSTKVHPVENNSIKSSTNVEKKSFNFKEKISKLFARKKTKNNTEEEEDNDDEEERIEVE